MNDLFDYSSSKQPQHWRPLAERMRPVAFDDVVGQKNLIKRGSALRTMVENDDLISMIFWGPPGTGKTTMARMIAHQTTSHFVELSAVMSGVPEIRAVLQKANDDLKLHQKRTILFIDEIHRLNKSQQDALLPGVEKGTIILIGATTENPSFEVNRALLSRSRVFVFEKITPEEILPVLQKALIVESQARKATIQADEKVLRGIALICDGDVRQALTTLELAIKSAPLTPKGDRFLTEELLEEVVKKGFIAFDKGGEEFYNLISALHKSLRGSDADASIYWLARMLEAGADPLYVARRLVRFASEDIGMADSQALVLAVATFQACHQLGMPECAVNLAHLVGYLAKAPKNVDAYRAYQEASRVVKEEPLGEVPIHLRNAPTSLMKDLGYGKDYIYTPENPNVKQDFLPTAIKGKKFW